MVCFTDIPLHLSQEHCGIYGKFAIAFKKSNFIKYGANPVTSHWYQRIDTNMSWHDAKSYAESLGGHLAIVTSQNENDFLWNNLAKDTGAFIWLGGTDKNLFT